MYGILQPLTVTRKEIQNEDGSFRSEYELIAGERRLRASKLAGLQVVPVIIRSGEQTEQEKLELAIIENLQREDLNAVDRALAFRQLADVFGLSHAQVAVKVGRSREYVSNSIRLLALPDYMLDALRSNDMSEGHARTLLMLNDRPEEQDVVFREILLKKLSVREVEKIARGIATEKVRKKELIDDSLLEMEKQFSSTLGTRVSITKTEFGGRLTIDYFSLEDLESMLEKMRKEQLAATRTAVPDDYRDETKDAEVSAEVDEEAATLAILARATGIEPVVPSAVASLPIADELTTVDEETTSVNTVVTESIKAVSSLEDAVEKEVVSEMSIPVVAETVRPESPVAIATPVPVSLATTVTAGAKPSLRDQLAALLGNRTSEPVSKVADIPSSSPVPPTVASVPAPTVPAQESVKQDTPNDDDLYSVTKFTI